jgi:hypothetical protein
MPLDRLRRRASRAALARVPERQPALARLQPMIDPAREAGVIVDELDRYHVLLSYDARDRDQFLAVDGLYDATYQHSTIEGDWALSSAPNNWMVIHFDYGTCRMKARAGVPEGSAGVPDEGRDSGSRTTKA